MVFFKDWIKAGIIHVADIVTSKGILPYQTICKLIGEAPKRRLQYNVIHAAVHTYLSNFGRKSLNDDLADAPVFHDQKKKKKNCQQV